MNQVKKITYTSLKDGAIDLHGNVISSLDDVPYSASLKKLILSENQIQDIKLQSVKLIPNLEFLDLSFNLITKIENLDDGTNINSLYLDSNLITVLENLEKLINLKTLSLMDNKISSFFLRSPLNRLSSLNISHNPVKNFNPKWFPNLRILIAENCLFTNFSILSELHNIEKVIISHNKLFDFSDFDAPNLEYLDASFNKLTSLEFASKLYNVHYLDVSFNPISDGISKLSLLSKVKTLKASSTKISALPQLAIKMPNLENLDISRIIGLKEIDVISMISKLPCLSYLNTISCFYNSISVDKDYSSFGDFLTTFSNGNMRDYFDFRGRLLKAALKRPFTLDRIKSLEREELFKRSYQALIDSTNEMLSELNDVRAILGLPMKEIDLDKFNEENLKIIASEIKAQTIDLRVLVAQKVTKEKVVVQESGGEDKNKLALKLFKKNERIKALLEDRKSHHIAELPHHRKGVDHLILKLLDENKRLQYLLDFRGDTIGFEFFYSGNSFCKENVFERVSNKSAEYRFIKNWIRERVGSKVSIKKLKRNNELVSFIDKIRTYHLATCTKNPTVFYDAIEKELKEFNIGLFMLSNPQYDFLDHESISEIENSLQDRNDGIVTFVRKIPTFILQNKKLSIIAYSVKLY